MSETKKSYEGMFLLVGGAGDFQAVSEPIRNILARNEAEILLIKAWDERRLTYTIRGHKRGLYILTFFKAAPDKIAEIEHDCRLDERFLRVLILRRDRLTQQEIDAEAASTVKPPVTFDAEARAAESEAEFARLSREGREFNKNHRGGPAEITEADTAVEENNNEKV